MEGDFGSRIKARRAARGMTLQELARASGVSVSMLSQVERGQREPTLPVAVRIAEGLGRHLSEILDEPPGEPFGLLRRADASGTLDPETGVRRVLLSRHLPPSVAEVVWYRVPAGSTVGPLIHRDADLLEQLTLLSGRLEVTVGGDVYLLRAGDTLSYPGAVEHRFENVGRTEASFLHLAHPRRAGPAGGGSASARAS